MGDIMNNYNTNQNLKNVSVEEYFENLSQNILAASQDNSSIEDNSGSWQEMANWFQWFQLPPQPTR